jgi:aminoglycoside phosphotransferase (APT) family kinase protein
LKPFAGGFVTDVYAFELDGAPPEWSGPLVLRVYPEGTDRLSVQRERCAQEVVASQGVPAPRVVAYDDSPASLGSPYMVMERMPGQPQMRIDFPRIFVEIPKLFTLPRRHAAAMFVVHELDAEPLIAAFDAAGIDRRNAGPDHWLDRSEQLMNRWNLVGLESGLGWLRANPPPPPERLSICHGDLFGANILEVRGKISGILDWNLVTVADRAFDIGGQIAAAEMSAIEGPRALQLAALGVGRLLARGLRRAYNDLAEISPEAVGYYAAMRAFTELAFKVAMEAEVRETGVARRLPTWRPDQCARYFLDRTGVSIEL